MSALRRSDVNKELLLLAVYGLIVVLKAVQIARHHWRFDEPHFTDWLMAVGFLLILVLRTATLRNRIRNAGGIQR